jgi:hypothetical protein
MYATPHNAIWLAAIGGGTGILGALLGTGGGVFLIPLLVLGFNVPIHYAVATSIISVIATSSAAASTNVERGTANMRLGMTLEIATSLGAMTGGLTAGWLAPRTLETVFAVVLVPIALLMWRGRKEDARPTSQRSEPAESNPESAVHSATGLLGGHYFEAGGREVVYRVRRLPAGLAISFVAGSLSGLLGIGGGVFKVPALHLLCGMPMKAAAATSNFMIGVTAAASAFLYYGRGEVRPALTALVVLGVLAGSALGSWLNQLIGGRFVARLFAALLVVVSIQMLVRAVWIRG